MYGSCDEREPAMTRAMHKSLHYAYIIPFCVVENLPKLLSGLFDVLVDTVRVAHTYLLCVRQSVINMHDFREAYDYDSDDTAHDTESIASDMSHISSGSRMSTRSTSRKKDI